MTSDRIVPLTPGVTLVIAAFLTVSLSACSRAHARPAELIEPHVTAKQAKKAQRKRQRDESARDR